MVFQNHILPILFQFMIKAESQGQCKKVGTIGIWSMKTDIPPSDVSVTIPDKSSLGDAKLCLEPT